MKLLKFQDGSDIYRAGDPSDRAFVIRSGKVVVEADGAEPVTFGPGEVFGATLLISAGERAESARAEGETVVASLRRAEILQGLDEAQPMAAALRALLATYEPDNEADGVPALPRLRLLPNGKRIGKRFAAEGLEIARLPFSVGRKGGARDVAGLEAVDLEFLDDRPYQLSRRHFTIQMGEDGPLVRDVGSHHGTVVNGTRIGQRSGGQIFAPLAEGENRIEAGGPETPFRFLVMVEPQG